MNSKHDYLDGKPAESRYNAANATGWCYTCKTAHRWAEPCTEPPSRLARKPHHDR